MNSPVVRFVMHAIIQPVAETSWLLFVIAEWGCWTLAAVFFVGESLGFELGYVSDLRPMMTKVLVFSLAGWCWRCFAAGARAISEWAS